MRSSWLAVAAIAVSFAEASPPPPPDDDELWDASETRAQPAIDACTAPATKAGLQGDVKVVYLPTKQEWQLTSTKSLGSQGPKIAKCIRDAIAKELHLSGRGGRYSDRFSHHERIGAAKPLLPAKATMLPIWRKASAGDAAARTQLAKLLPVDYTLTADACLKTEASYVHDAETLWLSTVGPWVPRLWEKLIPAAVGHKVSEAFWLPGEFIVRDERGLCLVPFDATKQAALRKQFDTIGSCWAGSFEDVLLHPRFELPSTKKYVSIQATMTRACALTSTGEVTCCGAVSPNLTTLPTSGVVDFALGGEFLCTLDKAGAVSCTGGIAKPPTGTFKKLAATHGHICGIEKSGAVQCWGENHNGAMEIPKGAFADLVTDTFGSCGLRKTGRVECWGGGAKYAAGGDPKASDTRPQPRGTFTRLFLDDRNVCALRKDGTVGCWYDNSRVVGSPVPGTFKDVAQASYQACGIRSDDTLACWSGVIGPPVDLGRPTPKGTFGSIDGGYGMLCGVGTDGHAECWGETWPPPYLADSTYPYAKYIRGIPSPKPPTSMTIGSRVLDENGAPLAGVDVVVCNNDHPCSSLEYQAITSPKSLADLIASAQPAWDKSKYAVATTDKDGRWSATLPYAPASYSSQIHAFVVTPGRELGHRIASFADAAKLGDFILRPATSVDIDVRCGRSACTGKLVIGYAQYQRYEGTHIERLPPGSYTIEVWNDLAQPTEARGTVEVDVDFTAKKLTPKVVLATIGGGNSIRGTARLVGAPDHDPAGLSVSSKCRGPGGQDVYRRAKTDTTGAFKLEEVGQPPCKVEVSRAFDTHSHRNDMRVFRAFVVIDKLPAKGITLEAREN